MKTRTLYAVLWWVCAIPLIALVYYITRDDVTTGLATVLAIVLSWRREAERVVMGVDWGTEGGDKTVVTTATISKDGVVSIKRVDSYPAPNEGFIPNDDEKARTT